jgi:mono/diheme cytochrome c family protein
MIRKIALITTLCIVPALAWAQATDKPAPTIKKGPAKNVSSSDGPQMFQSYCSACHGKTGKGDGPAAPALKTKPADLTMVAKNHGGTFSVKDFEDKMAGLSAHGNSEMPVWGPIFRDIAGNDKLRIYNLKTYIDSIQAK